MYFIGRKEAKEELNVKSIAYADADLSDLMSKLYSEYANEMELQNVVWNPENEIGINASQNRKEYKVAFVDSVALPKTYGLTMEFKRQQVMIPQQTPQGIIQVPQEQVAMRIVEQGWK